MKTHAPPPMANRWRRAPLAPPPLALPALLVVATLWPAPARALPVFARRYNVPCVNCHSAPPYLNKTGRRFKEAGYRLADEEGKIDNDAQNLNKVMPFLYIEKTPPIAARAVVRPAIVKRAKGDTEFALDSLHEFELLIAGNAHPLVSFFGEMETEDEDGFAVGFNGRVGFHPWLPLNVSVGWGAPFAADAYNSLKDGGHRLTIAHKAGLNLSNVTGAILRKPAQFITVYGRVGPVYYSAGYTGNPKVFEGEDPKNATVRLAVDVGDVFSAGAFAWIGLSREVMPTPKIDLDASFQRAGVDFNVDAGDFHALGLFLIDHATQEPVAGGASTDALELAGYAEFFYTWRSDNRTLFMPLLRLDYTSSNDHADHTLSLVTNVSSYVFSNVRLGVEFDVDLAVPDKVERGWRVGLLGDIVL